MLHHDYDWKGYEDGIKAVKEVIALGYDHTTRSFWGKTRGPTVALFDAAGFDFEYHYRPAGERTEEKYILHVIFFYVRVGMKGLV